MNINKHRTLEDSVDMLMTASAWTILTDLPMHIGC